jgi:hypothetical protein
MTASYVALHFVFALLFLVLQFLYHDHLRDEIRLAFHDIVTVHTQIHSEYISDNTRFPVMSYDGKLVLDPFPTDPLEFHSWFDMQSQKSNAHTLKIKNSADKTETVSYLALFLLAWRWNLNTEIWAAADADIAQLNADAIIQQAPFLTADEKSFLKEDEALFHFNDARTHRQMQVIFRSAVLRAVEGHRLYGDLAVYDKSIGKHDLYQGSRLLNKLLELASLSMRRLRKTLLPAGLNLPDELLGNPDLSKIAVHAVVTRLGKYSDALAFAGYISADS